MSPDRRRALLTAALGFALVRVPVVVGHVAVGMRRQGGDLQLTD